MSADTNDDDHTPLQGQCFSDGHDDHRERDRDQIRKWQSTFACGGKDATNGEAQEMGGGGIR